MQKKLLKQEFGIHYINKIRIMNYIKAFLLGVLVWLAVSITFFIMENVPAIKDLLVAQAVAIIIAMVFYTIMSASIYYRRENKPNGLVLGVVIAGTALLLDVLITVPFIEIPNGRGYRSFFSNPLLWVLVNITIFSVYFYWRQKIRERNN